MKKLVIVAFMILFIAVPAMAIDWVPTKQFTAAWDEVTTTEEGGSISYEVVLGDEEKNILRSLWTGVATQAVVTIDETGKLLLGVKSLLTVAGEVVAESEIGWSDDPATTANKPWGVIRYIAPDKPINFRPGE